jgi:hypothetical protein
VPDVGPGPEQALVLLVQAGFAGAGGATTSGGAALVVLDEGL